MLCKDIPMQFNLGPHFFLLQGICKQVPTYDPKQVPIFSLEGIIPHRIPYRGSR